MRKWATYHVTCGACFREADVHREREPKQWLCGACMSAGRRVTQRKCAVEHCRTIIVARNAADRQNKTCSRACYGYLRASINIERAKNGARARG